MSRWEQSQRDFLYKVYITDALQAISENTTHLSGISGVVDYGRTLNNRWVDIIEPPKPEPVDDRPCTEIAADIWERIQGRKVKK